MDEKNVFSQMDFGPLSEFLENDDVTDISYSNGGQVWLKTLTKGVYQVERPDINNPFMEKLAFQCANVMGDFLLQQNHHLHQFHLLHLRLLLHYILLF